MVGEAISTAVSTFPEYSWIAQGLWWFVKVIINFFVKREMVAGSPVEFCMFKSLEIAYAGWCPFYTDRVGRVRKTRSELLTSC